MTGMDSNEVEVGEAPFPEARGKTQLFISDMPSVGKDRYNRLLDNGFNTLNGLYQASESEITEIDGIGEKTAQNIKLWIGDQLVDKHGITDSRMNSMSVDEIADLYNISEDLAIDVKHRYEIEVEGEMKHISE